MEPYKPTSREFYDELEVLVMLHKKCNTVFRADNGATNKVTDKISKLYRLDDAEYLALESGLAIRLDHIINIDGISPQQYC